MRNPRRLLRRPSDKCYCRNRRRTEGEGVHNKRVHRLDGHATRSTSLRLSTKADAERIAVMEFQIREIESLLDKIHIYEFSKRVKVAMVLKWIKCGRSFECFL